MKIVLKFSLFLAFFIGFVSPSFAVKPTIEKTSSSFFTDLEVNSVDDFLSLTPKKIKAATGKKVKLKDRIVLKIAQRQVEKQQANGELVNYEEAFQKASGDFHLLWFLLGIILPLLSLILAILFHGIFSSEAKWALIGLLIGALLYYLLFR